MAEDTAAIDTLAQKERKQQAGLPFPRSTLYPDNPLEGAAHLEGRVSAPS